MLRLASRCKGSIQRRHGWDPGNPGRHQHLCSFAKPARLAGKVAIITGAASGIGKVTAAEFIRNGASVILADIQTELGRAIAAELGPAATFIHCDVTKESKVDAAVGLAVSRRGRLDVLFNNAGIAESMAPSITELDLADFDRTVAVNARAAVAGIKHAARVMVPRRAGCILCVTGILGGLAPHDYSISKGAVIGAVRSTAGELCQHGVRVNCISPHAIATPFGVNAMKELFPGVGPDRLAEIIHSTGELEGTWCEAVDVAKAAVYLAPDEAKFISGHYLVVDAGCTVYKRMGFSPR